MIGKLKGIVDEILADNAIVDVSGVGYAVYCPAQALAEMNEGEHVTLHIVTHVREDMIRLYGFRTREELSCFELLQAHVQGVGAKVAMSLLSTLGPPELTEAVASGDAATISRAPGIGKKVAERIIAELKNKLPHVAAVDSGPALSGREATEAVSALVNLGYPKDKAAAAVTEASKQAGEGANSPELIRLALKVASAR